MNIDSLPLPRGLRMQSVAVPSTLAIQDQFQLITNGRDLVAEGEPLPEHWTIPVPKLIVINEAGETFSVEGADSGLQLQRFIPGTPPKEDKDVPTPEDEKKPEPPDFWDRQAEALMDKVKDAGKDVLQAGLVGAWNDLSVGGFMNGCFGKGQEYWETLLDPDKLMSLGIGEAAGMLTGELMNLWAVDDKSSAAEQISRHLVSKYIAEAARQALAEQLEELLALKLDPPGVSKIDLVKSAFSTSGCFLAAKECDTTDHPGVVKSSAAKTSIHELAAVRITDAHACSGHPANKVIQGNPTIFIEGLPASRVEHQTVCGAKITPGCGSVYYGEKTFTMEIPPSPPSAPLPASLPPAKPAAKPAPKKPAPAADASNAPTDYSEGEEEKEEEDGGQCVDDGPIITLESSKEAEERLGTIGEADMTPEQIKDALRERLKEFDPEVYEQLKEDPEKWNDPQSLYDAALKMLEAFEYKELLPARLRSVYNWLSKIEDFRTATGIVYSDNPFIDFTKEISKDIISNSAGITLAGYGAAFCGPAAPACAVGGYFAGSFGADKAVDYFIENAKDVPKNLGYIWQYLTTPVVQYRENVYTDWSKDQWSDGDSLTNATRQSQQIEDDYNRLHSSGSKGE